MVETGELLRGHNIARHGLESALWDIVAQTQGISLSKALGGTRDRVAVGVSIGIQSSADTLINKIEDYLSQGYGRIKIKIKPGYDLEVVKRVRAKFPSFCSKSMRTRPIACPTRHCLKRWTNTSCC